MFLRSEGMGCKFVSSRVTWQIQNTKIIKLKRNK